MHRNRFYQLLLLFVGMGCLLLRNNLPPAHAGLTRTESSQPNIDAYIEQQMHALQIPGLAIAIVRGDQIAYVRGYGVADRSGRPVTPQTPFLIASLSKSFTALGIMQLAEEGKIRLDAPIQAYLPWFQVADAEASSRLTIRHLLYHSSGLSELEGYKRNLDRNTADSALEESVLRLKVSRLNHPPGERFEYSNTNYDILGLLIQTASGKSYETYIEERVFTPLNMRRSFTSLNEARDGGLSSGYTMFFGMTVDFDRFMPYSRSVVPSAGLFSSAEDMARYLFAHLNQGRGQNGATILSPAGMAELHTPGIKISDQVRYAMGWTIFPFTEVAAASNPGNSNPMGLSHGGDWANFKAVMVLVPEHQLGVVVLMNKNDPTQASAYTNIGWNTALLALGLEPVSFPRHEDFLTLYGRYLLAIVLLLLMASFVWSARRLFKRPTWNKVEYSRRRQSILFLVVLPLLDLALSGFLLFVQLPQSTSTLPLTLSFEPDIGLMYLMILVLTLGWGAIRTALAIRKLSGTGEDASALH